MGVIEWQTIGILVALVAVPPIAFVLWMQRRERYNREPLAAVLTIFVYGATLGVLIAFILNTLFDAGAFFLTGSTAFADLLVVLVVAPIVEEAAKGLGLRLPSVRKEVDEMEDGIVYGAAVGLGFAMSENVLYGAIGLVEGVEVAILVIVLRVGSAMILHAGASAILGYGISRSRFLGKRWIAIVPYYILAVLLHAVYNGAVTLWAGIGFLFGLALVWFALISMRRQIRRIEAMPHAAHSHAPPPMTTITAVPIRPADPTTEAAIRQGWVPLEDD